MVGLIFLLVEVRWGDVHDLLVCPDREHAWYIEQGLMDRRPIHFIELIAKKYAKIMISLTCHYHIGPESKTRARARCHLLLTSIYCNWLQGKILLSRQSVAVQIKDGSFCHGIHTTVELRWDWQEVEVDIIVLVCPYMAVGQAEGDSLAMDHDGFEYI